MSKMMLQNRQSLEQRLDSVDQLLILLDKFLKHVINLGLHY